MKKHGYVKCIDHYKPKWFGDDTKIHFMALEKKFNLKKLQKWFRYTTGFHFMGIKMQKVDIDVPLEKKISFLATVYDDYGQPVFHPKRLAQVLFLGRSYEKTFRLKKTKSIRNICITKNDADFPIFDDNRLNYWMETHRYSVYNTFVSLIQAGYKVHEDHWPILIYVYNAGIQEGFLDPRVNFKDWANRMISVSLAHCRKQGFRTWARSTSRIFGAWNPYESTKKITYFQTCINNGYGNCSANNFDPDQYTYENLFKYCSNRSRKHLDRYERFIKLYESKRSDQICFIHDPGPDFSGIPPKEEWRLYNEYHGIKFFALYSNRNKKWVNPTKNLLFVTRVYTEVLDTY